MKRGFEIFLVLIVLLSSVSHAAEPNVLMMPDQVYETNSADFTLNISNFRNSYEIKDITLLVDGFNILLMPDYEGWSEAYNRSTAHWSDGSIGTNVVLAVFEVLGKAPAVESDTEAETKVTLADSQSNEYSYTFPVTILNDETPPEFSDIIPLDGSFVKQGNDQQLVQVNAVDPETGIENVSLHWVRCNYNENITPQEHTLQLALSNGIYQNSIDLSQYENEQHVCFDFTSYNKGGEKSSYSGELTVDGVPPSITLVSPIYGAVIGLSKNFSFFSADNLASAITCDMYIDGKEHITDIEAEYMDVVFIPSADVEEGNHTWSMSCTDPAGLVGQSETWTYTLDKTPPQIEMTTPGNNSVIADGTLLEFEATDNNQLEKVWFIYDGNETQMESAFSVSVVGWPDGPSEFTVRARDSVNNQAEQTYRVIIDRSPPQIELLSPADNTTSDVHVTITYRAQDDYDEEMDCRIYIDGSGQEQHSAKTAEETSQLKILQLGEYRWNVQCVDEAGNTGLSEERQLSVIDTSGPDMETSLNDVIFRGDPVEISLDVTDVSGVGSVSAQLKSPDGNTQSIPLDNVANTYTALVQTTLDSVLGTYTLEVYAVDALNNSNTAADSYLLTYKYVVELELNSGKAEPGEELTASGSAKYDNGSTIPENTITITLPDGQPVEAELDQEGGFSYAFTAPEQEGTYNVSAEITSQENGQQFIAIEQFTVHLPQQQVSVSGGGGGWGGTPSSRNSGSGSSGCSSDWSCTAWTSCSDGEQSRTCSDLSHCSADDSRRTETRSCKEKKQEEAKQDDTNGESDILSAVRSPLPDAEEQQIDTVQENKRDAAGIGEAIGFMNLADVSLFDIVFSVFLMTVLLGTLYRYGWAKGDNRKHPAAVDLLGRRGRHNDLEAYLERRASRMRI